MNKHFELMRKEIEPVYAFARESHKKIQGYQADLRYENFRAQFDKKIEDLRKNILLTTHALLQKLEKMDEQYEKDCKEFTSIDTSKITEDAKLLNEGYPLTDDILQHLVEKYADNPTMSRLINEKLAERDKSAALPGHRITSKSKLEHHYDTKMSSYQEFSSMIQAGVKNVERFGEDMTLGFWMEHPEDFAKAYAEVDSIVRIP